LKPGGAFAIQMPNNFHSPSHQLIIKVLQGNATWKPLSDNLIYGVCSEPVYQLPWYYDVLTNAGAGSLQLWETEYFQEMTSYEAIFDWLKGTGLRPVLSVMDRENQTLFADIFVKALAEAYPRQANKNVLLPYRRVFMVGIMQA
jgi:trans-aconitate 2-methyltransferase